MVPQVTQNQDSSKTHDNATAQNNDEQTPNAPNLGPILSGSSSSCASIDDNVNKQFQSIGRNNRNRLDSSSSDSSSSSAVASVVSVEKIQETTSKPSASSASLESDWSLMSKRLNGDGPPSYSALSDEQLFRPVVPPPPSSHGSRNLRLLARKPGDLTRKEVLDIHHRRRIRQSCRIRDRIFKLIDELHTQLPLSLLKSLPYGQLDRADILELVLEYLKQLQQ